MREKKKLQRGGKLILPDWYSEWINTEGAVVQPIGIRKDNISLKGEDYPFPKRESRVQNYPLTIGEETKTENYPLTIKRTKDTPSRDYYTENIDKEGNKKKTQAKTKPSKTVSQIWTETTGLPWKDTKRLGYTSGTYEDNIALMSKLNKEGNFLQRDKQTAIKVEPAGLMEYQRGGQIEHKQIQEEVVQALANGADPMSIIERLIEYGLSHGEAERFVQEMMMVLQQQGGENPSFQQGGEMQIEEVMQGIAKAIMEGEDPNKLMEYLVSQGMDPNQAKEMIETVTQQMGEQGQFQAGGEMEPSAEDILNDIREAIVSGEDPREIIQQLISSGVSEEQAIGIVEQVQQSLQ